MSSPEESSESSAQSFYRLDADDRIVEVGGAWDEFALENDGVDAVEAAVVGTSIWSNIDGDNARMYLRAILTRARLETQPITIDYFCNSPALQRKSQMKLTSFEDGSVLSEHRFLSIQPLVQGDKTIRDASKYVKSCTICKRVWVAKAWIESKEILNHPDLRLFFGICDDCKPV